MTKQYNVKKAENIATIAQKFGLPSWKYLYQLNKDIIGNNPDILNEGTMLAIPEWETSADTELIRKKEADPSAYFIL